MKTIIRARSAKTLWPFRAVLAISLFYFLFYAGMSHFLYANLLYNDFDLAVHAQTLWNLVHGSGQSSILGVHFLANHFIPFFYLLEYPYRLFPNPLFLVYVQSFALAAGVFLSYKLASRFVSSDWSFFVALAYFFYPVVGFTNLFEFHPTALAVPFLFLMLLGYVDKKLIPFFGWAFVSMTFQENIAFGVLMMGLLAAWEKRGLIWIAVTILFAAAWIYLALFLVQPELNQGTIQFYRIYSHLGNSLPQIALSFLTKPTVFLGCLLSFKSLFYFLKLLSPLLFLPLLGTQYFLVLVPFILQHLLSSREAEQTLTYHYAIEMVPWLIAALCLGIRWFVDHFQEKTIQTICKFGFVISFFVTGVVLSPYLRSLDQLEMFPADREFEYKKHLLSLIPPQASVVATFQFLPRLSQRGEVFSFHHVYMGTYTLSDKPYLLPKSVQYVLLDLQDEKTLGFGNTDSAKNFSEFFEQNPWEVVDSVKNIVLLKKNKKSFVELFEMNPKGTTPKTTMSASVNDDIQLQGFSLNMGEGPHQGHPRLFFFWKSLKKTDKTYNMLVTLVDGRGHTVYEWRHPICYRIYPTQKWQPGETILEKLWFVMPPKLPHESLELRVGVYDETRHELQTFQSDIKDKIDTDGRIKLETFDPY